MRNFIRSLPWFLLLAIISLVLNYLLTPQICGVCTVSADGKAPAVHEKPLPEPPAERSFFILDSSGKNVFEFPGGLIINSTNGKVAVRKMPGWQDSIYRYLNENQGKELLIIAKYLYTEGRDRGTERALHVKNLLSAAQINPSRMAIQTRESTYLYDDRGEFYNGIILMFKDLSVEHQKEVEKSIENKTLYAEYAATNFKPDRTLQAYVFELKAYLEAHPGKKITVTGHTDDRGSAAANHRLGMKRARAVADYLISQGIDKELFIIRSKGESEPIETNDTDAGRAKNRRIEIEIK